MSAPESAPNRLRTAESPPRGGRTCALRPFPIFPVPPELAGAQRAWAWPVKKSPTRRRGCEGVKLLLGPNGDISRRSSEDKGGRTKKPRARRGQGRTFKGDRCASLEWENMKSRRSGYPLRYGARLWGQATKQGPGLSRGQGRDGGRRGLRHREAARCRPGARSATRRAHRSGRRRRTRARR